MESDRILKTILQLIGSASLLALIFVIAPHAWMSAIHDALGMGPLPDTPIIGYLTRSASALWALIGGLLWRVSLDLGRYREILIYLGVAITLLGVALLTIDWAEGLPFWWKVWEGPFVIALGLVLLARTRRIARHHH